MKKHNASYRQIVKSTSIFGGVQIVNILAGIIRTKFVAILLGTTGVGMIGIYHNVIDLIRSISGLGIDTGGIRDIASNADNKALQDHKISVFRWWVMFTAIFGFLLCLLFCYPISIRMFGDAHYTLPIAMLSFAIFFTALSFGQSVVLQGKRMISAMAKAGLMGNIVSLIVSVSLFYFFGLSGIIPSFIAGSIIVLIFTHRYYRKIKIPPSNISHSVAFGEGLSNLRLGLFIISASIINTASMFFIRSFLNIELGLDAVGVFQAAWTITNIYLMLILRSMGTDYYPRLCSIIQSNKKSRRLVNEQTYIVLVVATPIVVVMLLFSRLVLSLLYSSEFVEGDMLLQWQIIGSFLKVISWPLAFVILAKGKGFYYLLSESLFFIIYLGFGYFLFPSLGLLSTGVAYLIAYIFYLAIVLFFAVKLCNFKWSIQNLTTGLICILFVFTAILVLIYLPNHVFIAGTLVSIVTILFAVRMLNKVLHITEIINQMRNRIFPKK